MGFVLGHEDGAVGIQVGGGDDEFTALLNLGSEEFGERRLVANADRNWAKWSREGLTIVSGNEEIFDRGKTGYEFSNDVFKG